MCAPEERGGRGRNTKLVAAMASLATEEKNTAAGATSGVEVAASSTNKA